MPKRATIYTYPWDLSDEGVDNALNTIADTAGLNSVSLGQSYHVSTYFLAFAAFKGYAPNLPPQPGDVWRLNLYRTGGKVNIQYITWSNTQKPKPQFHAPERFGFARFVDQMPYPRPTEVP